MHRSTLQHNNLYAERIQTYLEVLVFFVLSSLPKPHCSPCSCRLPASTRFSIVLYFLWFWFPFALAAEFWPFSLLSIPVSFPQTLSEALDWLSVRNPWNIHIVLFERSLIVVGCLLCIVKVRGLTRGIGYYSFISKRMWNSKSFVITFFRCHGMLSVSNGWKINFIYFIFELITYYCF